MSCVGKCLLPRGLSRLIFLVVFLRSRARPEIQKEQIWWNPIGSLIPCSDNSATVTPAAGADLPGVALLLHHGPLPRLELAQPRRLRLPRPLHHRPLLHPGEPALAPLQPGRGAGSQVNGSY